MRVLLYEYKKSLRILNKRKRELHAIISKKKEMEISKYKKVVTTFFKEQKDIDLLNNMISDIEYAIQWISNGREPGRRRGVDKTTVYLKPVDILDQCEKYKPIVYLSTDEKTFENNSIIKGMLSILSDREREVYILHHVELLSFEEISNLLGVSKGTIQSKMNRAEKKIRKVVEHQ